MYRLKTIAPSLAVALTIGVFGTVTKAERLNDRIYKNPVKPAPYEPAVDRVLPTATISPQSTVVASAPPQSTIPASVTPTSAKPTFDYAFYEASAQRNAQEIAELTQAFIDLGPGVDPYEAARAARVVYTYVDQLAIEYEIEDGPLAHNTKVNFGIKPRGLCWHWAHDIDARLQAERFRTLQIHRAIANHDNLRLEHSTTILGRRGDTMEDSIVLDPWRLGGKLFWEIVRDDTRYNWTPRDEVFAYKRALKERREAQGPDNPVRRRD